MVGYNAAIGSGGRTGCEIVGFGAARLCPVDGCWLS